MLHIFENDLLRTFDLVNRRQVWRGNDLLLNTSSTKAAFQVKGLPGDASLQLKLFTVSPHAKSVPLVLHLKTRPSQHETIDNDGPFMLHFN